MVRIPAAPAPPRSRALSRIVLVSRLFHGLVSVFFLSCIAVVYVGAWRGEANAITLAALAALCLEGVLVSLSKGNCPLGPLFRRLGDDTPLFQLVLGSRAGKLAFPVLTIVTVLGVLLLIVRTLA